MKAQQLVEDATCDNAHQTRGLTRDWTRERVCIFYSWQREGLYAADLLSVITWGTPGAALPELCLTDCAYVLHIGGQAFWIQNCSPFTRELLLLVSSLVMSDSL